MKNYIIVWYDHDENIPYLPYRVDAETVYDFGLDFKYVTDPVTGEELKRDSWSGKTYPADFVFKENHVNEYQRDCVGISVKELTDLTPHLLKWEKERSESIIISKRAHIKMLEEEIERIK